MAKKGFFSWFRKDKKPAPEVQETPQDNQAELDAEKALALEAEQAAKAEEEAQAKAEQEAEVARQQTLALEAEQAAKAQAEAEAQAKAEQETEVARQQALALEAEQAAKAQAEAEAQAKAEQEAEVARQQALALEAEQAAKAQAEAEAQAKAEQEAEVARQQALALEAEQAAKAQAEAEAQAKAEQEAEVARQQALALEAEQAAKAQAEAAAQAKAEQEAEVARQQALALEAEQAAKAQAEAEALAKVEQEAAEIEQAQDAQPEPQEKPKKEGMFARLKRGLMRTSENIGSGFKSLFSGKKIDDDLFEELEEQLLIADVGVETTTKLINSLTDHASRKQLKDAEALYDLLREEMQKTLEPVAIPLVPENTDGPFVILMVGVNGVGKTTTIGKLAKQYQKQGKSVMLAAGDTFRAAAVEQLQVWGQRNDIPVVAQHTGADSASVLFDALQAAKARNVDVLIADTAGRLQNKSHLMEELKKVVRVMQKQDPSAPHEVMLTLDASTGQNAINQAQLFQDAVGVTGITLSKLDGTAKGGVIFAIADKLNIPIRHIGVGEQIDDLRTFDAGDFIEALFDQEKTDK